MKRLTVLLALLLALSPAKAAEQSIHTGIYAHVQSSGEGDWGVEITLVRGQHRYFAMVQCFGPEPKIPELAPVRVDGQMISFELSGSKDACGFSSFEGRLKGDELTGVFYASSKIFYLKRVSQHWQQAK